MPFAPMASAIYWVSGESEAALGQDPKPLPH